MSNEPVFQCPVCRAKQTLAGSCRRCKADLRLVMRAYRRLEYLRLQQERALADGDPQRAQVIAAEIRWLAPRRQ
jgi:hypothetical protein